MKPLLLALSVVLITSVSTNSWAGERGRHWHDHNHHRHHHHHYKRSHRHNHGAYLAGGIVLGAVINELARPRDTYVKETVYVTRSHYDSPREFRLEGDGRCYEVEQRGDRRILLEVPRSACY